MAGVVIDGKVLAESVRSEVRKTAEELKTVLDRSVRLAVVLVGDNPASRVYVRAKTRAAKECGIAVTDLVLPADIGNKVLDEKLKELSADYEIDGILLQLPLPPGLSEADAIACIAPRCDVDGLHPENQGKLMRGTPCFEPCTPKGCMFLIDRARSALGLPVDLSGLNAVVVGRSLLVGKPLAMMLLSRNCTVTQCHSRTVDLKGEILRADILIAAVGRPRMISGAQVKEGAVVIDVGINRLPDGSLVGDVDFESVRERAAAITPVPGGVGPMTIAMLLKNTVESAAKKARSKL